MEIELKPDQEARLAALAVRNGRKTDDLIREAVDRERVRVRENG
jgi:predicted DNA-binding protein